MFFKRLSITLFGLVCIGNFVLGANNPGGLDANTSEKENPLAAPMAFSPSISSNSPTCNGDADGYFTIVINTSYTGTSNYTYTIRDTDGNTVDSGTEYSLSDNDSFETNKVLSGDITYTITVVEVATSSSFPSSKTITEPTEVVVDATAVSPDCSTDYGTITIDASGGNSSSYTYYLNKGLTGEKQQNSSLDTYTFGSLASGDYTATVYDANGCPASYDGDLSIEIPEEINPTVTVDSIECPGETAEIILKDLPSDKTSYQIELNGAITAATRSGTTATITDVAAGSYTLEVIRPDCSSGSDNWTYSDTIDIENYASIVFSWDSDPNTTTINCYGEDTVLTVTVTGGRSGKTVNLSLRNDDTGITDSPFASNLPFDKSVKTPELKANTNYTLIAEDASGVCSFSKEYPFYIDGPEDPFVINNVVTTDVSCNGDSDGTIKVVYSNGGSNPYYSVDNGSTFPGTLSTDNTITGLSKGSYNVVLKSSGGCLSDTMLAVIDEPDLISVNLTVTSQLSCPGGATGSLMAVTTGGATPRYYTLTDETGAVVGIYNNYQAGDTISFPNLSADDYTVSVTGGSCSDIATSSETIDSIPEIEINISYTPVECHDESVTSFFVNATGGDGSKFTYTLTDNSGNPHEDSPLTESSYGAGVTFSDLDPGKSYTVQASYGSCSSDPIDTLIVNPTELEVNYLSVVELNCYGDDTTITISATGESPFYISEDGVSYNGFDDGTETSITGLTAGTYTYYIKDAYDCVYNDRMPITINVTAPQKLSASYEVTRVTCKGEKDGAVTVKITGGTAGYTATLTSTDNTYSKSSSTDSLTFTSVAAGTYSLMVTDKNDCSLENSIDDIEVKEPEEYVLEKPVVSDILCYGDSAEVVVSTSGGWLVTSYITVTGKNIDQTKQSGSTFTLPAGSYTISAENEDGCTADTIINIDQPDELVLEVTDYSNVSCKGSDDAQITFTVSGGTPDYYYAYGLDGVGAANTAFTGDSLTISSGLEKGTYYIVARDDNGCPSNTETVTISEPDSITFDYVYDTVSCYDADDATITIYNADGGNDSDYHAFLTSGGSETEADYPVITGLAAGTYSLRITDGSESCSSESKEIKIIEPTEILITKVDTTGITCYGDEDGKIVITANGGKPYGLEYKVTGRSYQDSSTFSGLAAGYYNVWVRNSEGNCETEYSEKVHISSVAELIVDSVHVTDVVCHNEQNGKVEIVASGGSGNLTYYLDDAPSYVTNNPNSSGIFSNLGEQNSTVTNYKYTVEDDHECSVSGSFSVKNPDAVKVELVESTDVICHDEKNGTITLTVSGGIVDEQYSFTDLYNSITYNIEQTSSDEYVLSDLSGTVTYKPIAIDDNNCSDTLDADVTITNPTAVKITDVVWGSKLCNGDSKDTTIIYATGGTGNFYYSLDNGDNLSDLYDSIFVGENEGDKYPYVEDENGCSATYDSYYLSEPDSFTVDYEFSDILCYYDESGDLELQITGGTEDYYLSINDPNFADPTEISKGAKDTTTYNLSELAPDITYQFYLKDGNGCHVQNISDVQSTSDPFAEYMFTIPDTLVLVELSQKGVTCADDRDGQILFTAEGGTVTSGNGYTLSVYNVEREGQTKTNETGTSYVANLFSGLHQCTLTDANGCKAESDLSTTYTDTITVAAANDSIVLSVADITLPTCNTTYDGDIKINVSDYLNEGITYYVEIYDSIIGDYDDVNEGEIDADDDYSNGDEINPLYYANSELVADYIGIGNYRITVVDNYSGCDATLDTLIISEDGDDCPELRYYNVFSPHNGDNENNEWTIYGSENQTYSLKIFTAYGELVYDDDGTAGDDGITWNGLDNKNRPVPVGTYIYILRKNKGTTQDTLINGNITILRSSGR